MKSVVVVSPKQGQVELQEQSIAAPGSREVQVRVHASVISPGTERAFILGLENTPKEYPWYPGYCAAGVVEAVGKEVLHFAKGDRVACILPHRSVGNITVHRVMRIPEGVSFEEAAFLQLGIIALQGVRKARIELGEGAMVLGLGMVGQLALQLIRLHGAMPVIGVDQVPTRLQIAQVCGADQVLDASDPSWSAILKQQAAGQGPPVVIEATGASEGVALALQSARPFGRVILLGSTRGESSVNFYRDVHKKGLTIVGAHLSTTPEFESRPGFWRWQDNAECFLKLLQGQRLRLEPLVTERVAWHQVEETYRALLSWNREIIGTVIKWQ